MCQDFQPKDRRGKELNVEEETKGLLEIQEMLREAGKSMKDFNLPVPIKLSGANENTTPLFIEQEKYSADEQQALLENSAANYSRMNKEQKNVYEAVLDSVKKNKGQMFAIDAPGDFINLHSDKSIYFYLYAYIFFYLGGTGKTFVLLSLLAQIRGENKIALAMATSGIAATLLPNGRTIHSKLKVPLKLHDKSELPYDQYKGLSQLINETQLMIVDEVIHFKRTHPFITESNFYVRSLWDLN